MIVMREYNIEHYIAEARKERNACVIELFSSLFKKTKSLLQLELPNGIPGPLAHR